MFSGRIFSRLHLVIVPIAIVFAFVGQASAYEMAIQKVPGMTAAVELHHGQSKPHLNSTQIPSTGWHYDWGQGQNGWGYCYEWTNQGQVLNAGQPVNSYSCEAVNPSRPNWGHGRNGWAYCYEWTPYGVAMNEGQPINTYSCEAIARSHFQWGRGQNGNTYCYQYAPNGYAMNEGQPMNIGYCRR
jgi:hypothetical protein